MKIRVITVGLFVSIIVWMATAGVDAQQEDARSTSAARIQALLVAKRDALKERFEFINAMHDDGTITYDAVVEANELLLQAELELAPSKERRAEIF